MRAPILLSVLALSLCTLPLRAEPNGLLEKLLPLPRPASAQQADESHIPLPEVYFSPKGGCTAAVVRELDQAQQTVLVQAYSFTSPPIAAALVAASRRGVRVEAVLDKSNKTGKYSEADFLVNARIPTWIDDRHAIAHNKVMVIDNATVITGSFNFTKAAQERNAENIVVIDDPRIAAAYRQNIQDRLGQSEPLE